MNLTNSRQKMSPQFLDQSKHKYISIFALSSNQVKLKMAMAANDMSNILISPDVFSTLMLLQESKLHKLQQQILYGISRICRQEEFC